jgi:hypothetical protein
LAEKELAFFHHRMHDISMKVVEKDKVISGMLRDELKRCREMLVGLQKSIAELPKGVLSERKKRYKDKVYSYYSLKYRDGNRVENKHIPNGEAPALLKKLEQRKKLEKEARAYERRIDYLSKILKAGKG